MLTPSTLWAIVPRRRASLMIERKLTNTLRANERERSVNNASRKALTCGVVRVARLGVAECARVWKSVGLPEAGFGFFELIERR